MARPFYNTPSLYSAPAPAAPVKVKTKADLEDELYEYRKDCSHGYCQLDPAVVADLKARIAKANT